jgi:radical SAM superfamily enzyme YgiQ (UPF0313 family)
MVNFMVNSGVLEQAPMIIFLVKPHPPLEVLRGNTPVPEAYKYAWEPVALKIIAALIHEKFPKIKTSIWHLIGEDDDKDFLDRIKIEKPDIVVFTEIDLLVNEVNVLAKQIKEINAAIVTLAGGKQSSVLRGGDVFPFQYIDRAFRGGPGALLQYLERLPGGTESGYIAGEIFVDAEGKVSGDNAAGGRPHLNGSFHHAEMRKTEVANQTMESYISKRQFHPSILEDPVRTSPCYFGEGCPHHCVFCQSPLEFERRPALLRDPREAAEEIVWLMKNHRVNNFFSLEANMDLEHLLLVYKALEDFDIHYAAVSGFIRALDIVTYGKKLERLARKGLRVLSVGLDIPADSRRDVYKKSFSYNEMREALEICGEYGVLVLGTMVGDPDKSPEEFAAQLNALKSLPVADVDIRLAAAIRNTPYYNENKKYLLYDPDDRRGARCEYFDRQNYRYQTIQRPGKIKPEETYGLVKDFYHSFYRDENHMAYVRCMLEKHPDTLPFFRRQYGGALKETGGRLA